MANSFVQEGNVLDWYNAGSAVTSGAVVQVGFRGLGIALANIGATSTGSVMVDGVFRLPIHASDTTAIGGGAWWDGTNPRNAPAAGRRFMGYFTETRSDAAGQTAGVKLAPFAAEGARALVMAETGAQSIAASNLLSGRCGVDVPSTAALTITLPALADVPPGAQLSVTKTTAVGAGTTVTLDGADDETINGAATLAVLAVLWDSVTIAATATGWKVVASGVKT